MQEREKVIDFIQKQQMSRFRVVNNTGPDKKIVGGQFPDILFLQQEPPPNNNILFVLKVEKPDADLVDSVPEWKAFGSVPSVFYVVVPSSRLDEARKLGAATGVKAKFAWYEMESNNVKQVHYE
jgi:hypothetical protein